MPSVHVVRSVELPLYLQTRCRAESLAVRPSIGRTTIRRCNELTCRQHIPQTRAAFWGMSKDDLALGELLATARLAETDFLALDFACVARYQSCARKCGLQRFVVIDQRTCNTVPNRAGLSRLTTT